MNGLILLDKHLIEILLIFLVNLAKPLSKETIKPGEGSLLHAALENHCAKLLDLIVSDAHF